MALLTTLVDTAMNIRFYAGLDALGNDIIKGRKYSNLKVTASPDDMFLIATAFGNLMRYEVVEILRSDDTILVQA
jgi:hypothetical protein